MKTAIAFLLLTASCATHKAPALPAHLRGPIMVRVCWSLPSPCHNCSNPSSCGTPVSVEIALQWINIGNLKYGEGTHWLQPRRKGQAQEGK